MPPSPRLPPDAVPAAVRDRLLDARADLVETVQRRADAVAEAALSGEANATRDAAVADRLAAELRDADAIRRFPAALADAVAVTGRSLPADPVAAPPYVVTTSVGPVLRATLDDGRLVITLRVFAVERPDTGRARYVRTDPAVTPPVEVAFRRP